MAFYPANVVPTSLSSGIDSALTDLPVVSGASYPDPTAPGKAPYKVLVGYNTSREEVCLVTAKPSTDMLRVTRGYNGSPATAKNAGDVVVPGVNAADFTAFQQAATDAAAASANADGRVSRAGDTMTGALSLSGDPVGLLGAATKQYVDGKGYSTLVLSGTGLNLTLGVDQQLTTVTVLTSQGASFGSLAGNTYTITASGYYLATMAMTVSVAGNGWNATSAGIIRVNAGGLPRDVTLWVKSASAAGGVSATGTAQGLSSGAVGSVTPFLAQVNTLTPFLTTDSITPLVRLSLLKLA